VNPENLLTQHLNPAFRWTNAARIAEVEMPTRSLLMASGYSTTCSGADSSARR